MWETSSEARYHSSALSVAALTQVASILYDDDDEADDSAMPIARLTQGHRVTRRSTLSTVTEQDTPRSTQDTPRSAAPESVELLMLSSSQASARFNPGTATWCPAVADEATGSDSAGIS